jgi:Kinesin motor domain
LLNKRNLSLIWGSNMPSESVKVMVRIRPMNTREKDKKCISIAEADSSTMQITLTNPNDNDIQKVFAFDATFPQSCAQQTVYESAAFQLVESVLEGYNGTIFAYGQTGCGKTHTMMGDPSDENLKGIIPRAFAHIFGNIESTTHKNFLIRCSFIEIYNEEIHDLIGPDVKAKLELKESTDKGVFIKGLSMQIVKSIPEIEKLMNYGSKNRSVGETAMNKDSSRSHSIFTIYIEASETQDADNQKIVAGKLNLVDLAGSERQSKTQATGDRLKEANKINLSLSALGNVISALVDGKSSHVPYRDSKLTRLLQDSLGGNTKTVMIANISPASDNYDETFGTLRYASRAKSIKNQPKINEDPKDALLREYQDEVARLKAMLEGRAVGGVGSMIHLNSRNSFDDEVEGSYSNVLREKDEALEEEIKRREELESKMKDLENQMVVGGSLPISPGKNKKVEEPQEKKAYQEMLNKLKTQEQLQQKLLEERQKKEEEAQEVEKKYANLQEEAEEVRKIAKKLRKKYKSLQAEIKDFDRDQEYYKGELLDTIRSLERDVKINNAIMAFLLSPFELEKIRSNSNWSEEKNEFIVPKFQLKVKKAKLPQLPGLNGVVGNTFSSKDTIFMSKN